MDKAHVEPATFIVALLLTIIAIFLRRFRKEPAFEVTRLTTDLLNAAAVVPLMLLAVGLFDDDIRAIALSSNQLIVSLACVAMLFFIFKRLFGTLGSEGS